MKIYQNIRRKLGIFIFCLAFVILFSANVPVTLFAQSSDSDRETENDFGTANMQLSERSYYGGVAVALHVGTLGGGLEIIKGLSSKLNVRAGVNFFQLGISGTSESDDPVDYDVDFKLFSIAALLDFFPFGGGFRFTGGMLYNSNILEGSGMAAETYVIDESEYTPEEIGQLTMKFQPATKWTPYLGLGLGNPAAFGKKIGFSMDIGVVYQGSPDVVMDADENAMIYPSIEQADDRAEDIKDLKWYPVLRFGLSFQL